VNGVRLTFFQLRFVNKAYWRNPALAFFTFVFPLMFLVIFTSLLGNGTIHLGATKIHLSTYYVAAMAAFAVVTSCYTNLAVALSFQRDSGVLKRIDGSPLPHASFMAARILHSIGIGVVLVVLTAAFGHAFYSAHIPSGVNLLRFAGPVVLHRDWENLGQAIGNAVFWLVWYVLIRVIMRVGGPDHPATEPGELHPVRKVLAVLSLVLFALLFMPTPWSTY